MKYLTGQLFDLAPDGLGFIVDTQDNRIWSFMYPQCGHATALDANTFSMLEGKAVRFLVQNGKVVSVELAAEQLLLAQAAGNS
jgi:hypothetical protein